MVLSRLFRLIIIMSIGFVIFAGCTVTTPATRIRVRYFDAKNPTEFVYKSSKGAILELLNEIADPESELSGKLVKERGWQLLPYPLEDNVFLLGFAISLEKQYFRYDAVKGKEYPEFRRGVWRVYVNSIGADRSEVKTVAVVPPGLEHGTMKVLASPHSTGKEVDIQKLCHTSLQYRFLFDLGKLLGEENMPLFNKEGSWKDCAFRH